MLKRLEKHLAIDIMSAIINIRYAFYESITNLFPTKLLLLGKPVMEPNQKILKPSKALLSQALLWESRLTGSSSRTVGAHHLLGLRDNSTAGAPRARTGLAI